MASWSTHLRIWINKQTQTQCEIIEFQNSISEISKSDYFTRRRFYSHVLRLPCNFKLVSAGTRSTLAGNFATERHHHIVAFVHRLDFLQSMFEHLHHTNVEKVESTCFKNQNCNWLDLQFHSWERLYMCGRKSKKSSAYPPKVVDVLWMRPPSSRPSSPSSVSMDPMIFFARRAGQSRWNGHSHASAVDSGIEMK